MKENIKHTSNVKWTAFLKDVLLCSLGHMVALLPIMAFLQIRW